MNFPIIKSYSLSNTSKKQQQYIKKKTLTFHTQGQILPIFSCDSSKNTYTHFCYK